MKNLLTYAFLFCALLTGCDTQAPVGGSPSNVLPPECLGASLALPVRSGGDIDLDGGTVFLREAATQYTASELIQSAPYRFCPACLGNGGCARHFEDVACDLLPARTGRTGGACGSREAVNPVATVCENCNTPTITVHYTCEGESTSRSASILHPCGCDDAFSVASDDRTIVCSSGDAWDSFDLLDI